MRTPWPSRSAPHHWIACQMLGSPNASPAWMVKWKFSRCRYSNASRCRVGGKPASAPAMSKPTTPAVPVAHRQLGDLHRPGRVPHRGQQRADPDRTAAAGRRGAAVGEPGQHRLDHLGQRSARAPGAAPARTATRRRRTPSAARSTRALVGDPVQRLRRLHHADRVRERLQVALQRAGVGRRDEPRAERGRVGRRQRVPDLARPARRSVAGRRPPSRWSCSSAFGALTISS